MAVDLPAPEYPEITTRSSRRDSMVSGAGVLLTAMAHMMTPTADHPRRATIYGRRRGGATGTGSDQAASAPLRAAVSLGAARVRPQRPRLVGLDARHVRPEDAVVAREIDGVRWHRCLRCDSW